MKKNLQISVIALLFVMPLMAQETSLSGKDILAEISGEYRVPSTGCTTLSDGKQIPCGPGMQDSLVIQKMTETSAKIKFFSAQTNLHECSGHGVAQLVGQSLEYCPARPEYKGACLVIEITKEELVFHLRSNTQQGDPFCGTRATLEGLSFSRRLQTRTVEGLKSRRKHRMRKIESE